MKNRAKCKLCNDILESFHQHDLVSCKCGEISIDGGQTQFSASAKDFRNFIRIDDENNEIVVKFLEKDEIVAPSPQEEEIKKLTKEDMLNMLDVMVKNIENLPQQALTLPVNHYDLYSFMALISTILRQ